MFPGGSLDRHSARAPRTQPDLFAAPAPPAPVERPPLDELRELLERLRAANRLPWAGVMATMAEEHRALGLARQAGPEGVRLAAAILDQTERLLTAEDQATSPR